MVDKMRIRRVFPDLHSINKDKTNLNMAQDRSDYFFTLVSYSKSRYEEMLIPMTLKSGQIFYMKLFFRILSCFLGCIRRKTSKHKNSLKLASTC